MPAWDNVSLAPPVTSRDYNQGFENFLKVGDRIAQLPQSYWAGQNQAYQQNLRNLFQNGVPNNTNDMVNSMIQAGGAPYAAQLAPFLLTNQATHDILNNMPPSPYGGQPIGGPAGQGVSGTGSSHLGGGVGANVPYASNVQYGASNDSASDNVGGSPAPSSGEGSGATTLASIAAPYQLPPMAVAKISRDLGIPANQPIGDPTMRDKAEQAIIDAHQPVFAQAQPREPVGQPGGGPSEGGGGYTNPSEPSSIASGIVPPQFANNPRAFADYLDSYANNLHDRSIAAAAAKNPELEKSLDAKAKEAHDNAKQVRDLIGEGAKSRFNKQSEYYQKQYDTYNSQGIAARDLGDKARLTKSLVNDPKFTSGAPFPEFINRLKAVASNIGAASPNAAMSPELFNKLVSDMLTQQIRTLGQSGVGRVLMSEVQNMQKGLATLQNTPASNRAQLEIYIRTMDRMAQIGEMARRYKGGNLDPGFDDQVDKFFKNKPLFDKDEMAHPEILGAPTMRAGVDKPGSEKTTWGMKPGDPYRTPAGTLKWVE